MFLVSFINLITLIVSFDIFLFMCSIEKNVTFCSSISPNNLERFFQAQFLNCMTGMRTKMRESGIIEKKNAMEGNLFIKIRHFLTLKERLAYYDPPPSKCLLL